VENLLREYAELIVRKGANVQLGQPVFLNYYAIHRDFAARLAEAAYSAGASSVAYLCEDPILDRMNVRESSSLERAPNHWAAFFNECAHLGGAMIGICGDEIPCLYEGFAERAAIQSKAFRAAKDNFYTAVWDHRFGQVTLAAAATPKWGTQVFPDLSEDEAESKLWHLFFGINRLFDENAFESWAKHDEALHARVRALNALQLDSLHFVGDGTDLTVGLSKHARFCGGSEQNRLGISYFPNLPTEEVYTTPDWRTINGQVRITRPVIVNGALIENLVLHYRDGDLTDFDASKGREALAGLLKGDPWAGRGGEIAIVPIDNAIYESEVFFFESLFDENGACHFAIGDGYIPPIEGGVDMSVAELESLGVNCHANSHYDLMISDETTSVIGKSRERAGEITLLEKGKIVLDAIPV